LNSELTTTRALISKVSLEDFRNYASVSVGLHTGQNVFVGANGQGKSNLLESIYVLSSTRSFRGARDKDVIRHGTDRAVVCGTVGPDGTDVRLEYNQTGGRRALVFEQKLPRVLDLVGRLPAVVFSSSDLAIVYAGPAERRAFIDSELSLLSPSYSSASSGYRKALEQRNAALRAVRDGSSQTLLTPWDAALAEKGSLLRAARVEWLRQLMPLAAREHACLTGNRELLEVRLMPADQTKCADELRELLLARRHQDIASGHTSSGPHRDDLEIALNREEARAFASQGQTRTIALALKLAVAHYWREQMGILPLLLLDDIMSDLDADRRHAVMAVSGAMGQVIITTTDLESLRPEVRSDAKVFEVRSGEIVQ
jgi:DNA replication and repair protein RecF